MSKMSKLVILTIVLLVLHGIFVSALSDFNVKLEKVQPNAFPGEKAVYKLTIHNLNEQPDSFILNFDSSNKWSVETENIAYLSGINLAPKNFISFKVYVTPSQTVNYGPHEFKVDVTSVKGGNNIEASSIIIVKDPTNTVKGYVPSINLDVDFPEEVDPRQGFDLKINLINKNKLDIPQLKITVESKLFSSEKQTSLSPLEKKTETFPIKYDPLTTPQTDLMTVTVSAQEGSFTDRKNLNIKGYSELIKEENSDDGFLKQVYSQVLTNNGNVVNTDVIKVKTSLFNQLFTTTMPEAAVVKENGVRYYVWQLHTEPQGEQVITVVTNYRSLFVIIFLCIVGVGGYYVFRSPIIVAKEAIVTNKEEGGITHIKVLLHVKNRTNKSAENVVILDRITHIAQIEKEFSHGTLKPEKILKHDKKGTILKWAIPVLEGYEERILSYKVKSRLGIIGHMRLPSALIKFKDHKGNQQRTTSNSALTKEK